MADTKLELVDFYAPWCGPCQQMAPIIEEAERTYGSRGLVVTKINVDEHPDQANAHQVLSIPTFFLKKEGKVVEQLAGSQPKNKFFRLIEEHLK